MKKIILSLVLFFAIGSTAKIIAQDNNQKVEFYYYPSSNIYYNVTTGDYWYYDNASTNWVKVKTLPTTVTLVRIPIDTVYYSGEDVWKDNAAHMKKYKGKNNGSVKEKPKKD